jgi:hypothetical protein
MLEALGSIPSTEGERRWWWGAKAAPWTKENFKRGLYIINIEIERHSSVSETVKHQKPKKTPTDFGGNKMPCKVM